MEEIQTTNKFILFIQKHSFFVFVTASILLSSTIVSISMTLYNISGAAQLDLSRPGYNAVRGQIEADDSAFQNFPANGPINSKIISNFILTYKNYSTKVKSFDAFGGDPLNSNELGIGVDTVTE